MASSLREMATIAHRLLLITGLTYDMLIIADHLISLVPKIYLTISDLMRQTLDDDPFARVRLWLCAMHAQLNFRRRRWQMLIMALFPFRFLGLACVGSMWFAFAIIPPAAALNFHHRHDQYAVVCMLWLLLCLYWIMLCNLELWVMPILAELYGL